MTSQPQPVFVISPSQYQVDRGPRSDDWIVARARQLRTSGAVVASCHWGSGNVILEPAAGINRSDGAGDGSLRLAERAERLLKAAGLTPEYPRRALNTVRAPSIYPGPERRLPMIHISIPVHFGVDLMLLVGAALRGLSDEPVLFVSLCGRIDAAVKDRVIAADIAALKQYAYQLPRQQMIEVYPLFFLVGISGGVPASLLDAPPLPIDTQRRRGQPAMRRPERAGLALAAAASEFALSEFN
ncbi:MAG: hypothetical protein ABI718_00765 [Acidobacteriota bacterium]